MTKGYCMTTPIATTINFRGTNITVTGHAPYMFEEDAETVGSYAIVKSTSFSPPFDSAEHLVGLAHGWGYAERKDLQLSSLHRYD
jgi:hypothetical protein